MIDLNVETENTTLKAKTENTALNVKRKRDMMALNVELRTNNGSERQNYEYDFEHQTEKRHDDFECQTKDKRWL